VSRHDDDGGNNITSGDGDDERVEDDLSAEAEIREWVGETAQGPDSTSDEASEQGGWFGRVFGRGKDEAPADGSADIAAAGDDQRLGADPEQLAVFSAVGTGDNDAAKSPKTDIDQGSGAESVAADLPEQVSVDSDEPGFEPTDDVPDEGDSGPVIELPLADSDGGQATFTELWVGDDDDESDEDISDFATFTSEDYLQATTREYVGLAEAVARAEEEDTQRIAVAAEIPGLESGLVGLEDVVSASGGSETADIIEPPASSDLPMRVLTAIGLLILFAASLLSPYGIGALIVVVLGIAAGEMFAALIKGGYRPLSIFGFAGVAGAFFGTWAAGPVAIPISLLLSAIGVFLFYATVPGRRAVLENATATLLVTAWVGGLGGLAFDFLGSDQYRWLVLSLVITVAIMDVVQYFIGRRLGRHPLAPVVSPKKTIEGYVAGVIAAVGVGAAFGWAEPFDLADGLIIGGVVAVVAPFGDLAVSVLKRALGVKDMGYILPGHGGVLDRVDAMIMTIPALWIVFSWMGLLS
jgi:phosphatidate cytidylyltransferase